MLTADPSARNECATVHYLILLIICVWNMSGCSTVDTLILTHDAMQTLCLLWLFCLSVHLSVMLVLFCLSG